MPTKLALTSLLKDIVKKLLCRCCLKHNWPIFFFLGLATTMQLIGWWVIGGYAASLLPWVCPVRVSRVLCFPSKVSDSVGFTQTEGFQWRLRDIRLINCEQQNNLFWQLTRQWRVSAYGRMLHEHEYYTIPAPELFCCSFFSGLLPAGSDFLRCVHCPFSKHVHATSVWPRRLYLQHIWHALAVPLM